MRAAELRKAFLKYFAERGHQEVASSSLLPANDPTLLFVNAGMVQFKDVFLGAERRSYSRATTAQKCLRIAGKHNDFEVIGVSPKHHTFFEMLGNFSFGDYFKAEAITYAWEFVTEVLKLDKERLWVTVFEQDSEAEQLWSDLTDVRPGRILRLGEKDNFWAMGDTGPCGPCSEIHYWRGDLTEQQAELLKGEDERFVEIWNLVFMQFNRDDKGELAPLPQPSVDTGMGLERVAAILQGVYANYDTDILRGIIATCEKLSGVTYDGSSYEPRDLRTDRRYAQDVAMRAIADHTRAATFLIADGVNPGSEGRSYVLRRLIRRAVRHGRVLEFKEPFMAKLAARVVELMADHYGELRERLPFIERVIAAEEIKFNETLDAGLEILQRAVDEISSGANFPGETAFLLHDTYGFPLDLTEDALKAYDLKVDRQAFDIAMTEQKQRSRQDRARRGLVFESVAVQGGPTRFLGYEQLVAEARLQQIIADQDQDRWSVGGEVGLLFEQTPFYAESGGQVGDTGKIKFEDVELEVLDTQKVQDRHVLHVCRVAAGELTLAHVGRGASLMVNEERRARIRGHHSATHLVHAALRRLLGEHVKQSGSRVDDYSLRFDYSHFEAISYSQLQEIERAVNEEIRANHDVAVQVMEREAAKASGALAFFGDKYGEQVRVVNMGNSKEFCGGTHVSRTGDIGLLLIASEGGISAGVRRIECVAGAAALEQINKIRQERQRVADLLKGDAAEAPQKLEKLLHRTKQLEKEVDQLKRQLANKVSGSILDQAQISAQGVPVIAEMIAGADTNTLREMVDALRVKLKSGVVALGSSQGDVGVIVAGVTSDLAKQIHVGRLIQKVTAEHGGKGGGRPDFAQAGGIPTDRLSMALEELRKLVG